MTGFQGRRISELAPRALPGRRHVLPLAALAAFYGLGGRDAVAHVGPPFPLLVDVPAGEDVVSVWADPDIGQATFYIALESPDGSPVRQPVDVSFWAEPVSKRLPRAVYEAERQNLRNRVQFVVLPDFDRGEFWNIGFQIKRPGAGPIEVLAEVESTPPGSGPWDLLIYFFPFAFLGCLWILAIARMRRRRNEIIARFRNRG